ncbi:hypothetical protein SAMD00019534_106700 [Acytostelium subglobosum LB1]|uniref:hypothetical protein n=1 Tax=Acytostelium subglobosum LB1 TaxID=1410327 RepID=UPI00064519A9|nr:hypothetical protein SAMD00019534_106700 [Acytostelium subglobosum LB1]GAM27494.1 hypothetical protein SAMD00019534_106700 [Acytostelium subglobosum LB1]|eukprot:XP_012749559.1 hypothetical protein SAMD00019534_106700 [Acytostelium subglobosum LB1]
MSGTHNSFSNFFHDLLSFNVPFDEYQTNDEYVFVGDVAGVQKEHINVNYLNGRLKIQGNRDCTKNINMFAERWCGAFTREFTIPTSIQSDKISASLKDGVLEVRVPKEPSKEGKSGKSIEIK